MGKFQIICGNPPYQGNGDPLYMQIANAAYDNVLDENGVMCMINPTMVIDNKNEGDGYYKSLKDKYGKMKLQDFLYDPNVRGTFTSADIGSDLGVFIYSKNGEHTLFDDWVKIKRFGEDFKEDKNIVKHMEKYPLMKDLKNLLNVTSYKESDRKKIIKSDKYPYHSLISYLRGNTEKKTGGHKWDWVTIQNSDNFIVNTKIPSDIRLCVFGFNKFDDAVNFNKWLNTDFIQFFVEYYKTSMANSSYMLENLPQPPTSGDFSDESLMNEFGLTEDQMKHIHKKMKDYGWKTRDLVKDHKESSLLQFIDDLNNGKAKLPESKKGKKKEEVVEPDSSPSSSEPSKPVVDDEDEETQDEVDLSMIDGLDRAIKRKWGKVIEKNNMRWSIIVGNPPYQDVARRQIYPKFYLWARNNCERMSMIFPKAWQDPKSNNGLGLMNTPDIKYDKQIISIDNIINGFKNVTGAKKTNIIYWKKGYDNGLGGKQLVYTDGKNPVKTKLNITEETVEKPEEIKELLKCVKSYSGDNFKNMEKLVSPMLPYNLHTKFLFDPDCYELPNTLTNDKINEDDIKVYGVINKKIAFRFVDNKYPIPRKTESFNKFKVFVYSTWGNMSENYIGGAYSNIIIAYPNDICTESFVEIGCFDTINEVKNLAKYIMSSFFRALLFLNKNQKGCTRKCYKYIPVQDFSEDFWKSDKIDDIDNGLFDKYNVPEYIRKFVRENIQPKTVKNILGYDGKDIDLSKVKKEDIEGDGQDCEESDREDDCREV